MKIFVTGATGYIGSAIVDALIDHDYQVTGLARSEESARQLKALGAQVHWGNLLNIATLKDAAKNADGVIHAAFSDSGNALQIDQDVVQVLLEELKGTNKPFIYTSGTLVYGDTANREVDEDSPLNPPSFFKKRQETEKLVLSYEHQGVRTIIVRPPMVYGRGGGFPKALFYLARQNGSAVYVGKGSNVWSTVHVDDLAQLFVRALELAPAGTSINASDCRAFSFKNIAEAISEVIGEPGNVKSISMEEARKILGPLAMGFTINQNIACENARNLYDWYPQQPDILEDITSGSYAN